MPQLVGSKRRWVAQAAGPYLAEDDLRGQVLRGPAQGPGPPLHSLGEAEVRDLEGTDEGKVYTGPYIGPGSFCPLSLACHWSRLPQWHPLSPYSASGNGLL
jgi:hypothetical protein